MFTELEISQTYELSWLQQVQSLPLVISYVLKYVKMPESQTILVTEKYCHSNVFLKKQFPLFKHQ